MNIFVTVRGKKYPVEASTVKEVQDEISQKSGLSPGQQVRTKSRGAGSVDIDLSLRALLWPTLCNRRSFSRASSWVNLMAWLLLE